MDLITTHQHADFDGMASMIAAKKLYPQAVMAFSGSQEKNIRDFFVQSTEYLYDFQRIKNIDLSRVYQANRSGHQAGGQNRQNCRLPRQSRP